MTVCDACKQGWQTGGGQQIAVDAAVVERASCDALHVGSLDGDQPNRARHGAFSPAVARFIWLRDQGRCQTPGCRSTVGLAIHHIDPQANNGSNDPSNGTVRCFGCHMSHHAGLLEITGSAPDSLTTRWLLIGDERPNPLTANTERPPRPAHADSSSNPHAARLDDAILLTQAKDALVGLGWKPAIARAAVEDARAHVDADIELEALIREALRRCPKPSTRTT